MVDGRFNSKRDSGRLGLSLDQRLVPGRRSRVLTVDMKEKKFRGQNEERIFIPGSMAGLGDSLMW